MKTFQKTFLKERDDTPVRTESLYDLAKIILEENYFELGEDAFRQNLAQQLARNLRQHTQIFLWLD